MSSKSSRHTLPGSERHALAGAKAVGEVHPDERIEVTLRLRSKTPLATLAARGVHDATPPARRRYLTRDEFAASHGADAKDLAAVEAFAQAHGLVVVESSAARCSVVLAGNAASLAAAFGVELKRYEHAGGSYRGRTGSITLPAELADVVQGVFGLDDRPAASTHFQVFQPVRGVQAHAASVAYTPLQLAALYDFPTGLDGSGQCIAIIELGGGYRPADLNTYFKSLGLAAPKVKAVLVDHGHNAPTTSDSADGEVMLDIEVAGAIAPKASLVVYFAPNTDQGFLDAITTAVHDKVNKPSVISISWGQAESAWTTQSMTSFDQAFQAAAAMGVTVCVAAGDNGSADGVSDGKPHVDFPASSPNVLGCGGTKLLANGGKI
ncbi:MAG TPA: S53 family peptidase, partial [Burkholderiaceae bacterium]